jgi:amino acid adenylation domain-containing protein
LREENVAEIKKEIANLYPLVPMQEGMLFHSLKEPESNIYFRQVVLAVAGCLDFELLQKSFVTLVERYDALRTVFVYDQVERPLQVVLKRQEAEMRFVDLSQYEPGERELVWADYLQKDRRKVFNLSREMLARITVIKTGILDYKILWSFHHILMDGWCTGILFNDLFEIYRSLKLQLPLELGVVPSYAGFIKWREKQDCAAALNYWRDYLYAYEQQASLPKYRMSRAGCAYRREEYDFILGSHCTKQMEALAQDSHVTLNTLFQAIWGIVLQIYNNTDDVVFGAVVSGRPADLPGVDRMVGLFINTIPVRVSASKTDSFMELLGRLQKAALEAERHSYFPLYEIQAQTKLKQGLFDHLLAFENYPLEEKWAFATDRHGIGFRVVALEMDQRTNYDFNIIVTPGKEVKVKLLYNANVYDRPVIQNIEGHLLQVIATVVANPAIETGRIDLLTAGEKQLIFNEYNQPRAGYPADQTIPGLFETQVEKGENRIAVTYANETFTYSQLNRRANQIARLLTANGVTRETIVGIMMYPSPQLIWSIIGILKAGGAYLPLDPDHPADRLRLMLEDSGAPLLLTTADLREKTGFGGLIIDAGDRRIDDGKDVNPAKISRSGDLAYIIYTSGTTGRPKGVMIEHRNVVSLMRHDGFRFHFDDRDVWTLFHSACFDFSVWEMYGALLNGGRLVVLPKQVARDTTEFLKLLSREKVTVLNQTPSAFYNLINAEPECPGRELALRYVIFGGAALKPLLLKEWRAKYPDVKLINMYGITETTVHVTSKEITEVEINLNLSNIGRPLPTLTNYVMDRNLRLMPLGAAGELCVGGAGVGRGYLNQPELTAEKFIINPLHNRAERLYRSGDLVRRLPNGDLEYLGRIDHQIKIRGFRVELGEIEARLLSYAQINEALVVCKVDSAGDQFLCAYLVGAKELTVAELRAYLAKELPDYMIPARFVTLDQMPLNANGKIDRKALPEPDGAIATGTQYLAPENETEEKLAAIWAEVLNVTGVRPGMADNYFSLGGDSIRAIRLVSLVNKHFKTKVQLQDLYESPTIRGLARGISKGDFSGPAIGLAKARATIERLQQNILNEAEQATLLPGDWEDFYPMSDIELGMVYYAAQNPKEAVYHDQFTYRLKDPDFQTAAFEAAIRLMAAKHSILRTSFHIRDFKQPLQIVHKSGQTRLAYFDLSNRPETESRVFIENYLKNDRQQPFELTKAPLWRMGLFKLQRGRYCLALIFHHAILDGWSLACLVTELLSTYQKLKEGRTVTASKLKCDYRDYLVDQLATKARREMGDYWKTELSGYQRFVFPPRESVAGSDARLTKVVAVKLNPELLDRVKKAAQRFGSDLKAICFAAYLGMLHAIGNGDEVVAGLVEHNRLQCEDGDRVLGCFLNTVPVRVGFSAGNRWEELLKTVSAKLTELKFYGRLSLLEILTATGAGMTAENPVFDTFFNFVDFHVYHQVGQRTEVESLADAGGFERNHVALDFTVSVTTGYCGVKVSYRTALFDEAQINRWIQYFLNCLAELAANPGGTIQKARIIGASETYRLLTEFNRTAREYNGTVTITGLFAEQARNTPEQIALVFKEERLTYRQLATQVDRMAGRLVAEGISSGSLVGIMLHRSAAMLAWIMAVLKAGAAYLPLDPEFPGERLQYMLEDSGAALVITEQNLAAKFDFNCPTLLKEDLVWEPQSRLQMVNRAATGDLAYVLYTSGSTGKPKGVMIEHRNVVNLIHGMRELIGFTAKKTILALTTVSFDIFVLETLLPLTVGMKIVLADEEEQKDPHLLNRIISEHQVNMLQITPSRLQLLLADQNYGTCLANLTELMVGGEAFPPTLLETLQGVTKAKIYNMYGPTETTVWSLVQELTAAKRVLIGKPIANTRLYILDPNGEVQPIGSIGELCIGGAGVARGYLRADRLTAAKFVPDLAEATASMYKTGDLARWLLDGAVEFMGRRDEQVKIRGFRVEPAEIETRLAGHGRISQAVVVAQTDRQGRQYLCAYYRSEAAIHPAELREYLAAGLPEYMIPTSFVWMEHLPLTPNGKVDRQALPDPDYSRPATDEFTYPQNETELLLHRIWRDVLDVEPLSTTANFFVLGGHSLKAAVLIARINREFRIQLPLRSIFAHPTITQLAQCIQQLESSEWLQIRPAAPRNSYPLTSEQKRIYLAEQVEEGSTGYNMPGAMIIAGKLDSRKFEAAFQALINRHESYRTTIEMENGELVQKIHSQADFKIEVIAKGNLTLTELARNFVRPFDLKRAPLLRVGLVKLAEQKHFLLFDVHHLISDGVSAGILIKEFSAAYQGRALPELKIQYKDYAVWQATVAQNTDSRYLGLKRQARYWQELLVGRLPVLDLPTDYPRATGKRSLAGGSVTRKTGSRLAAEVMKLALEYEATPFMVLLAAYSLLLAKLSGQPDLIIGTPVAGRFQADLEAVIGMFVNTLPFRIKVAETLTVGEFIGEIKEVALRAFENQNCRFEEIVETLGVVAAPGRNPLFDTLFVMQNMAIDDPVIPGLHFTSYEFGTDRAKLDLSLEATAKERDLALVLKYRTGLFKPETAAGILENYLRTLEFIVADRGLALNRLELADSCRRRKRMITEKLEFRF